MTNKWLLDLTEIDAADLPLVGVKALNLSALNRNRVLTPPGLVVTTTFFEQQIAHFAYSPLWAGSPDVAVTEGALEFLADFLKITPLAPALDAALRRRMEACFPAKIRAFAVRSSAVDEDRQDHSFAGCYLTELGVPRQLLPVSLTRCWASALSGRSIRYRLEHGMSLQSIKIAVLIQPMLSPSAAGVAFSVNPVTGARDEMVIEATPSLGEAVVSGRVTPYRYHLSRRASQYPLIKKAGGDLAGSPEPLTEKQLVALAQTVEQVEALMGAPQDVEWAYQDNQLYVLQSRPVTVAPAHTATPHTTDSAPLFDAEWTRANHPETLPELPSPLFISLMERTQERGLSFFEQMGLNVSGVGPYIASINGRPYLNLTMIKRILAQLGLNSGSLLAMAGYSRPDGLPGNPFSIDWNLLWRNRRLYRNFLAEIRRMKARVETYRQAVTGIIADLKKNAATPTDLLAQFKLREQVYGDLIGGGLVLFSALAGLTIAAARLVAPLAQSADEAFSTLGTLGKDPAAVQHNLNLMALSRLALADAGVLDYLTRAGPAYTDYTVALAQTEFLAAFEGFLQAEGYRATYEQDMAWPRYAEQPETLLRTVAQYAQLGGQENPFEVLGTARPSVGQTWRKLTRHARGLNRLLPWRQALALPLMQIIERAFLLRGAMRTAEAQAMAAVRQWDLRLAEKWVKAGYLDAVDDYFWLAMAEVERALATDKAAGIHFKPAISARKIAYQGYAAMTAPFVVKNSDIPALALGDSASQEVLEGTLMGLAVSPGQVQGEVYFLEAFAEIAKVPAGKILVAPSTDPVYLPYFHLAAGLIVEVGGMLSHGSIIAREYHLPAVSAITDARKRLRPGDRVLLDGSTGVIQILEKAN